MSQKYPVENLLRSPVEIYSAITLFSLALLALKMPQILLLHKNTGLYAASCLGIFGGIRAFQAYRVKRYHWRLLAMPYFAMSTREVPVSGKRLFVGRGFCWQGSHTQRLHQVKQVANESYLTRGKIWLAVRDFCKQHEKALLSRMLSCDSFLNPFRPEPDVGGKPWLHGVGDLDVPVYIPQNVRGGHTLVLGTTGVGKTRLSSILVNQDIRNGDAVIVIDPKGDLELLQDMYAACSVAGRLDDFRILHLGFPELSAHYNPLKNFDEISEVATRVTAAMDATGEGAQFAAFAWKYVNIVSTCLSEMKEPVTYDAISFYITRPDQLLMIYADVILSKSLPDYHAQVESILAHHDARVDKNGNPPLPMDRVKAVLLYLKKYIADTIAAGNMERLQHDIIMDLYDAAVLDKTYYDKITASVGPVLSEITRSNASGIFSFRHSDCEIRFMEVIQQKKVVYIGLDSLANFKISQAVGKAILSDLVSTAGKIYKQPKNGYKVNIHCDELSEIIQESFVKILNKARGAGFQVTAYAQTKQDLEVALGSKAMAEVTKGNMSTLIMLRVENEETANLLVSVLPKVDVVSHTEVSMASDTPHGENGVYFNTTNEDRVTKNAVTMLEVNDITSLPKGQAFMLVNGGELYKIRIPLPKNDGLTPKDIKAVIRAINKIPETCEILTEKTISDTSVETLPVSKKDSDNSEVIPQDSEYLPDFIAWLQQRITSGNEQFSCDTQELVVCNINDYGNKTVFLLPEVLEKYESRSGIGRHLIERSLKNTFPEKKYFHIRRAGKQIVVFPCELDTPFTSNHSTLIHEGVQP